MSSIPGYQGITVLICTHNGADRLPQTLRHLAAQQMPAGRKWEVLLVSNASTDETLTIGPQLWTEFGAPASLRTLNEPKAGKPAALALGFAEARYEFICILDDDNWLKKNYIATAFEILTADATIGALGGRSTAVCETAPPVWFNDFAGHYAVGTQDAEMAAGDITVRQGWVCGAGSIIRKSAWQKVEAAGFESILVKHPGLRTSGEDIEMCYALRLAGYRIWFDARLYFQHFIPENRLNWKYLCSLYESNAASEVDLQPYRHFLQHSRMPGRFKWLRDGLYITRFVMRYGWKALRQGQLRSAETTVNNLNVLNSAYYRWSCQHYLEKQLKQDTSYEKVKAFINRLQALPPTTI